MEQGHQIHQYNVDILLTLVMVITTVAMATKWIKVPYSVALVVVGLAIGIFKILPPVEMTPDLILVCVLPPLLFEAAWNINLKSIKADWLPILVLATIGVLFCMLITAGCLNLIGAVALGPALVFGALIAATDAVSVVAVMRTMHLKGRITTLLEGESIFNDGTSMVLFNVVLSIVVTGASFSFSNTVGQFALASVGGSLVGLLIGLLASKITSYFDDYLLEITLTVLVAYGSYLLAEQMHISPVIAVVVAGMVYGTYGSRVGMSPSTRSAINLFWHYLTFVVNSLVFLLIGLQVNLDLLIKYRDLIGVGILSVTVARLVTIYGLCPFVSRRRAPIPDSWRHLLVFGGLRGASCMALALSLPRTFELREGIIVTTFGIVLFTLLFQGMTLGPLIKLLGLRHSENESAEQYQILRARLTAQKAALEILEQLRKERGLSNRNYQILSDEIAVETEKIENEIDAINLADQELEALELRDSRILLLEAQEDCLRQLSHEGVLNEDAFYALRELIAGKTETLRDSLEEQMQTLEVYRSGRHIQLEATDSDTTHPGQPEECIDQQL